MWNLPGIASRLTCLLHHLCALVRKRGHVESGVFCAITMLRTNRTSAARLAAGLRAGLSFGTLQVRGAAIHVVAADAKESSKNNLNNQGIWTIFGS